MSHQSVETMHPGTNQDEAKDLHLERRRFLRASALAAATAVAAKSDIVSLPILSAAERSSDVQWNQAPCRFCGTGCHVQVGVQDGKVVAIATPKSTKVFCA
jgi:nitrate reductase NapA